MINYPISGLIILLVELPQAEVSPSMVVEADVQQPKRRPIQFARLPIASTFCVFQQPDSLLSDPNDAEESLSRESVTVVMDTDGKLCRVYKTGGNTIGPDMLRICFERARQRTRELADLIVRSVQ